jgi:hypothetical protein
MIIRTLKTNEELRAVYKMSKNYTNNHQTWGELALPILIKKRPIFGGS